jgi:hypothetical protein
MSAPARYTDTEAEEFLRSITPPEEELRQYTSAPRRGSFCWFRSPNIVDLVRVLIERGKLHDRAE